MAEGEIVAICQFGGKFVRADDGTWSYSGGEGRVIDISREMPLNNLKAEIADMFDIESSNFSIKYMLPSNKHTLITISRDKDLTNMVDFNMGSVTTDIYISNVVENRETRTPIIGNAAGKTDNRIPAALSVTPIISIKDESENLDLVSLVTGNGNEPSSSRNLWGALITDVGQEFDNAKAFRVALCKYAYARGFKYKYVKNNQDRLTAQCDAENCPWTLHASGSSRNLKFSIKKIHNVHTCGAGTGESGQLRVTKLWLAGFIKEKLLDDPQYKPKEIARDVYQVHGIHLNYTQAWHAREAAFKELRLLHEEISHLPLLRDKILETNPGSVVELSTSEDSKIRRLFIAFRASLEGFRNGCRPLIFLDRIYLKANDTWRLMVATGIDGDDEVFPVAFAFVESETPDSWHWFLVQLKEAVSVSGDITIFSSRRMELDESVPRVFEGTHHCYSLSHVIEEFKAEFKNRSWTEQVNRAMVGYIEDAAQAYAVEDFDACIEKIRAVSENAADWVLSTKPEHWSNTHFRGARYGHFSSNIVEPLSKWLPTKDELSVVQMVEAIRAGLTEVFDSRRNSSGDWVGIVSPSVEVKLSKVVSNANPQTVVSSSGMVFEVQSGAIEVVDVGNWECTCRRWQLSGLPCEHAADVAVFTGGSVYDFCSEYFKRERYLFTYSGSINPIPEIETLDSVVGPSSPPLAKPSGGRRKRVRIETDKTTIRPLHCSRCKVAGHNKSTCNSNV